MVSSKSSKLNKTRTNTSFRKKQAKQTKKLKKSKQQKKILSKQEFDVLDYPFRNIEIDKKEMKAHFNELKNYKGKLLNYNPSKRYIEKYKHKSFVVYLEHYDRNKDLYEITDYFSDKCRMKCVFNLREEKSIHALFQQNKKLIIEDFSKKKLDLTLYNIKEYLFKHHHQCTNFNTTMVMNIMHLFKPKRWLDCSSGWGDRLVGAIAYGKCEYQGVDPSKCMRPIYKEIIKDLATKKEQKKYSVICDGFENVKLKDAYYDLVFTSPPFFNLEIYENESAQSIEQFNTVDKWKHGFLFPLLKKSYKSLELNGHLALYITDFKGSNYIKEMKHFIRKKIKGFKYEGDIHWWYKESPQNIRTVYIWKKIR